MLLSLNEDQTQILDFVDSLTRPYASETLHGVGFALTNDALDAELVEGGFLNIAAIPELGTVTAALAVEKLARLPFALETAFSAIVRPAIDPELPRPLCLVREGNLTRPLRFLQPGASVVVVGADGVRSFTATEDLIRGDGGESLYGYPVAFLTGIPAETRAHDIAPAEVERLWRVAIAAEIAGLLAAALQSVVTYTSERKQFGRPIATFQALRHRMAEAQVVTNAAYWLAMKAAGTARPADAAMALNYGQEAAKRVVYDYHQFLGGMGMTLEHPLHLWTYRLRLLTAELGGRGANALTAADALWG
jgi:hypothetical protein